MVISQWKKGFLLSEGCIAKKDSLTHSSGKRGKAQMNPDDVRKTKENLQILV